MPSVAQSARAQSVQSTFQLASKPGSAGFVRRSRCRAGTTRKRPRRAGKKWKSGLAHSLIYAPEILNTTA